MLAPGWKHIIHPGPGRSVGDLNVPPGVSYVSANPTINVEIYDPSMNSFTPTANMLSARSGHTATLLWNGRVLLTGGFDGMNYVATAELWSRLHFHRRMIARSGQRWKRKAKAALPSPICRSGLPRRNLIFEVVGIEAVESALGRFRLRIHEEA